MQSVVSLSSPPPHQQSNYRQRHVDSAAASFDIRVDPDFSERDENQPKSDAAAADDYKENDSPTQQSLQQDATNSAVGSIDLDQIEGVPPSVVMDEEVDEMLVDEGNRAEAQSAEMDCNDMDPRHSDVEYKTDQAIEVDMEDVELDVVEKKQTELSVSESIRVE